MSPAFAVSDSEMCFLQPVDQCGGINFEELGTVDADSDGRPYNFEADISNAGQDGTLYLQYKDRLSTSFSNETNSDYNILYGSNEDIHFGFSDSVTVGEGNSTTVTINGVEHTFEVNSVDVENSEADFDYDGINQGTQPVGYDFSDGEGGYNVLYDVFANDRIVQASEGDSINFESDSGTQTFNVVTINENNIEYNINGGSNQFLDEGESIFYDGQEILNDGIVFFGTDDPSNTVDINFVGNGAQKAEFRNYQKITSPEGHNEYRVMWVGNDGSTAWSDSLWFSVDRGSNIPGDKAVDVNDVNVNQPRTLSGVVPDSDITLTLAQEEQDPVNITLIDASDGTRVSTISTGDSYGEFRQVVDEIGDAILATFTDTGTVNEFTFPTTSSDLLSQQGTTYNFYFEIKDKADSNVIRNTKTYTVQTSGTATNQAPNISTIEARVGGSWKDINDTAFGDNITRIRTDITDPDNSFHEVYLQVENLYDGDERVGGGIFKYNTSPYDSKNGTTYYWNMSESVNKGLIDDSGNWKAIVYAQDGANNNKTRNSTWSYPFGEPSISLSTSNLVQQYTFFNTPPTLELGCPQYECINENESINVYLDPKPLTGNKVPEVEVG